MENKIAIIPARSGSKRIKNKNITSIGGKPLIYWTIKSALDSKIFNNVIVSTDSLEYKEVCESFGAEVFLRKKAYDDISPISEATLHTVSSLGFEDETIIYQLMANCPLRSSQDILNFDLQFTLNNTSDSLLSCIKFNWLNPWWAFKLENGLPSYLHEEALKKRSQDLDELYCPTGSIWVTRLRTLKKYKSFYTGSHEFKEISFLSGLDIDTNDDLEFAKYFFK